MLTKIPASQSKSLDTPPPKFKIYMHACMLNMFTKSYSSPDKNLMCCARQFSFIAIVSAKMAVVNEQAMCICKLSFVKYIFEILS